MNYFEKRAKISAEEIEKNEKGTGTFFQVQGIMKI